MRGRLDYIGIVVDDMARSLAFYRALGLAIPPEADSESHVEVTLDGGMRVAWDTVEVIRSFDPEWTPPSGGDRMALGFQFDAPAGVDETYAALSDLGYRGPNPPWDAFWGQRYAIVLDPDGNAINLYASLPPA